MKYQTSHQLARKLLKGPDLIIIFPSPHFDMPGSFTAMPVIAKKVKVQGTPAIAILPGKIDEPACDIQTITE